MRVLVTGAGGYVGSRLVPALIEEGHHVVASSTRPESLQKFPWGTKVETVAMNIEDADEVQRAVRGVDAVYYLIHGMGGGDDFADRDRQAARTLADAVRKAKVERVVYLSGLVSKVPEDKLSEHVRSRLEVEETLGQYGVPTITLRAGVVLGAGSTSFEIIRQISERLPVQTMPSWMDSDVEPIAVVDAVAALVACLDVPAATRHYDIGSGDRMAYSELLQTYADIAGITRPQTEIPGLPTKLVGFLAGKLTDAPDGTVEALLESLHEDMVTADADFRLDLLAGHTFVGIEEALRRALGKGEDAVGDPMTLQPSDPDWAGGRDDRGGSDTLIGKASEIVTRVTDTVVGEARANPDETVR